MPFQPPSIMQACMILLAAPKLAASMPASEKGVSVRQDPDGDDEVLYEGDGGDGENTPPIVTPIVFISPVPTPQPATPSGSTTPVVPPEPEPYYAVQGCWAEPKKARALDNVWMSDSMTPELCATHAAGYAYYGVEYGKECWYGNTLRKGTKQRPDTECTKPCAGDPTQTCGDGMKLNLWRRTDAFTPLDQPNIGDYILQGCYVDTLNPRALKRVLGDDNMTPQMCMNFCGGSAYMGLEYGRECWCDDVLDITSFKATLDECQMPCAGDLSSMCGSPNRMDLYKLSSPPPQEEEYFSMGCYFDVGTTNHGERALPELYADDNMSVEMCAGFAARRGFKHFGVEYGRECWAGHQIDPAAFPTDGCDMVCSGNDSSNCGGRKRLHMFTYDVNDIYQQQTYTA